MSNFYVLDQAVPSEEDRWLRLLKSWQSIEVFANPNYASLFARSCDRVLCAVSEQEHGIVVFPFLLRPLRAELWNKNGPEVYDIINPYGYGGPYFKGDVDADKFWDAFDSWALNSKVVSTFARLSLFDDQIIPFRGNVVQKSLNVIRRLDLDLESIWMEYEHKVRKNVKKALRMGVEIELDWGGRRLNEFMQIYYATMQRRNASQYYYFNDGFFRHIIDKLGEQACFFHAIYEDKVISTELVLISEENMYSYLGGTLADFFDLRPNDLLKHNIILWGHENHKKCFILGGGYEENDGIYHYKKAFAPDCNLPFKTGTKIYDSNVYEELTRLRKEVEPGWVPDARFFPEYRS